MSFFRKPRPSDPHSRPLPPPPITTSFSPTPTPTPPRPPPTLRLPMSAIVQRPAFASAFRSFLVSKYCQENIDFLLAVERYSEGYEAQHPRWRGGQGKAGAGGGGGGGGGVGGMGGGMGGVVGVGGVYVPLDLEEPPSPLPCPSPLPPLPPSSTHTNLPRTALEIYSSYILLTGPHTVNIPAHTRITIEAHVTSLQSPPSSGTAAAERSPLSTLLTPALFDSAVSEICSLLEREWLTKFYATSTYSALVQLMDRKERQRLMKEEAAKAKTRLNQQLRRVAATVQAPPSTPPPARDGERRAGEHLHVRVDREGLEYHLSPGQTPHTPVSPVSSLKPSEVRQAGRLDSAGRGRKGGEEGEKEGKYGDEEEPDSTQSALQWSRDVDTASPMPPPDDDHSPLSAGAFLLLTPAKAGEEVFRPVSTPGMHLTPRRMPRKVVVHPSDEEGRTSLSYTSLTAATSLPSHRTPTPCGAGQRGSQLFTPVPWVMEAGEGRLALPFSGSSSAGEEEDGPVVLITHQCEEEEERQGEGEGEGVVRRSPEPSTASPSPSPMMRAWPESSHSGEASSKQDEGGYEGSDGEGENEESDKVMPLEDGQPFFSVLVAEDSDDDDAPSS